MEATARPEVVSPVVGRPSHTERTRSSAAIWTGRVLSALSIALLALDGVMKLVPPAEVVKGTVELGFSPAVIVPLGITLLGCVLTYAVPRTSVLGAVLLTGYLGGAVATHVRAGHPMFSHVLAPVYVALFVWGGLFLRDRRVRALLPFTRG